MCMPANPAPDAPAPEPCLSQMAQAVQQACSNVGHVAKVFGQSHLEGLKSWWQLAPLGMDAFGSAFLPFRVGGPVYRNSCVHDFIDKVTTISKECAEGFLKKDYVGDLTLKDNAAFVSTLAVGWHGAMAQVANQHAVLRLLRGDEHPRPAMYSQKNQSYLMPQTLKELGATVSSNATLGALAAGATYAIVEAIGPNSAIVPSKDIALIAGLSQTIPLMLVNGVGYVYNADKRNKREGMLASG
jgi:hypothetical protein